LDFARMMALPRPALQAAALRKSANTLQRATVALAELEHAGGEVTFQRVARTAGVSRQWLYRQPKLRARIELLRAKPPALVPARQRSSDESLRQRLTAALEDNQRLRAENQQLRTELAGAYGTRRAETRRISPPHAASATT
jgi:hypothetical protein